MTEIANYYKTYPILLTINLLPLSKAAVLASPETLPCVVCKSPNFFVIVTLGHEAQVVACLFAA